MNEPNLFLCEFVGWSDRNTKGKEVWDTASEPQIKKQPKMK